MIAGQGSDAEDFLICLILGDDTHVCVLSKAYECVYFLCFTQCLSVVSMRVQMCTCVGGSLPASNLNDSSCPSDPTFPRVTSPLMEIRLPGILQKSPPSQASLLIHRGIPGRRQVNMVWWADAPFVNHVCCGRGKLEGQTFFSTRK